MTATTTPLQPGVSAGSDRFRFGIEFAPSPDWGATRDFAQTAEALGFDSLWIPDHPGGLGRRTPQAHARLRHPPVSQPPAPLGFDSLWLPAHPGVIGSATWTTLAALATVTNTIRLGPLVACAAYWNPVILAHATADVDRLSQGRMVLGLGSGDMPPE